MGHLGGSAEVGNGLNMLKLHHWPYFIDRNKISKILVDPIFDRYWQWVKTSVHDLEMTFSDLQMTSRPKTTIPSNPPRKMLQKGSNIQICSYYYFEVIKEKPNFFPFFPRDRTLGPILAQTRNILDMTYILSCRAYKFV